MSNGEVKTEPLQQSERGSGPPVTTTGHHLQEREMDVHEVAYNRVVDLLENLDLDGFADDQHIIGVLTGALQAVVSATYYCAPDVESAERLIEIAIDEVRKHECRIH